MSTSITYDTVIEHLIMYVPEFERKYKTHLEDNYGELLPHLLFSDLLRFAVEMYRSATEASINSSDSPASVFERILDFVEAAARSHDERVVELVHLSFLENLHQAGPDYEAIKSRLGPVSRKLLSAIEDAWY